MKIIDLLNKIANGEEVPKRIIYDKYLWYWCEPCKCYETTTETGHEINLYYYLSKQGNLNDNIEIALLTDDEIEIIEEDKEIEKLNTQIDYDSNNYEIVNKINELVIAVNELKKGD